MMNGVDINLKPYVQLRLQENQLIRRRYSDLQ